MCQGCFHSNGVCGVWCVCEGVFVNACVLALPLLLLTAVVDVGGDVDGRVVVRGQPFKGRVLRKVRSDPVLPALRVVGIQLGQGMRRG